MEEIEGFLTLDITGKQLQVEFGSRGSQVQILSPELPAAPGYNFAQRMHGTIPPNVA
jgi:hypothetical protein